MTPEVIASENRHAAELFKSCLQNGYAIDLHNLTLTLDEENHVLKLSPVAAIAQARRDGAESALALVAERLREIRDDVGFRVVCNTENPCAEPKEPAHDERCAAELAEAKAELAEQQRCPWERSLDEICPVHGGPCGECPLQPIAGGIASALANPEAKP